MKQKRFTAHLFLGAMILLTGTAHAKDKFFELVNNTNAKITFAITYREDNGHADFASPSGWVTRGWWQVPPNGGKKKVYMHSENHIYYVRFHNRKGLINFPQWGLPRSYWVHPTDAFRVMKWNGELYADERDIRWGHKNDNGYFPNHERAKVDQLRNYGFRILDGFYKMRCPKTGMVLPLNGPNI